MLENMRVPTVLLVILILAVPARAQSSASNLIVQAFQLWKAGQPRAAIAILDPLLKAGFLPSDPSEPGVAWNVLGHSYLDLDQFVEAQQAYQHAMQILRPLSSARAQYASTLDSMGIVEECLGHQDAARALSSKARKIYAELGDSAGVAITSINLAVIALGEDNFKAARKLLQTALQSQPEAAMKPDDAATFDLLADWAPEAATRSLSCCLARSATLLARSTSCGSESRPSRLARNSASIRSSKSGRRWGNADAPWSSSSFV